MKGRKRKTHFTAVKLKEGSRKVKSEKESDIYIYTLENSFSIALHTSVKTLSRV